MVRQLDRYLVPDNEFLVCSKSQYSGSGVSRQSYDRQYAVAYLRDQPATPPQY